MDQNDLGWIYTTINSEDQACALSKTLVEKKWAACVNVIPKIISYYEEDGTPARHTEAGILIKTSRSCFKKIQEEFRSIHGYECPCLVFLPFEKVSKNFASWMRSKIQNP